MKKLVMAMALLAVIPSTAKAECTSQDLLAWVDRRESIAISPTRWQNVRKSLLGQEGGMSLDAMQVIYDRRVSRGWSAGHWVPILNAMNCLKDQAEQAVVAEVEAQPAPQAAPAQAEVEPAQEPTADLSQPPASFVYFDDKDEIESGGETWTKGGRRTHNEWIRPNGGTANESLLAWNEWGPWDDLPADVQQSIHDSVGLDHSTLASGCGGFNSGGLACTPQGENLRQYNLDLQKWTWRGDFTNYTLHPTRKVDWGFADVAPQMVFEYNPSDKYAPWFAYVEYTRANGQVVSLDHWYGIQFENGSIRDKRANDGPGDDGLSATFYRKNDYYSGYADNIPENSFLIGEVRRPKIIGTFVTGTGQ